MHGRVKVKTTEEQKEAKRKEREKKLKIYNGVTSKIWKKKEEKEFDDEALLLTREVLASNPDFYTMWNFRKEMFIAMSSSKPENDFQTLCSSELSFLEDCLQINPKSYGAWHHRCWIMDHMPHPDWKKELKLCDIYLQYDERNFHCWDYRRFVVARSKVEAKDELEFSTSKISSNFSNFSSWHYRSKLLPVIYPDEEKTGRVCEDILLQEYELAQNAFFTDPNDQSAWFYHRWLLGRGDSPQNINFLYANKNRNMVVVAFAQPVLFPNKNEVVVTVDGQILDGKWTTSSGQHVHSFVWVLISACGSINGNVIKLNLDKKFTKSCTFAEGDFESWSKETIVAATLFTSQLSVEKSSVLTQELESCQQLLELEPDNKWCVFTIIQLMRSLDPLRYESETNGYVSVLLKSDPYRANYFRDLHSRFCIENEILKAEIVNGRIKSMDLSSKNIFMMAKLLCSILSLIISYKGSYPKYSSAVTADLTTLTHLEHLVSVTDINLSSNQLSSLSGCHMLQCVERIIADDNNIVSLKELSHLPSLMHISINNNNINSLDDLSNLTWSPNLKRLCLKGNPVCQTDGFQNAIKNLLPQVQYLNGVQL